VKLNAFFTFQDEMVASDKVSLIGKLVTLNFYPEGYPLDGNDKTPPSVFVLFARLVKSSMFFLLLKMLNFVCNVYNEGER